MDGFFIGELGNRLKVSITDSSMMSIVNNAMDKAHAKVKSGGVIGRLNEISRFYELAVIQLEGCMRLVQEEAEDTSHRDLVFDLGQVRDHLLGRLEEAEMAISQKDREMIEIWENVLKLRQVLELRERELSEVAALRGGDLSSTSHENHMMMAKNSAGAADLMLVLMDQSDDKGTSGEFRELVDQKVWNMRRHNYELSRNNNNNNNHHHHHHHHHRHHHTTSTTSSIDNKRIERMGSDITNLKETFDMAFGKIQSACETGPVEQQWKWSIERDVTALLIKGFINQNHVNYRDQNAELVLERFSQLLLNFQQSLHDCLVRNNLRLADIKCQLDLLSQQTNSLKKRELLYKKAFARRCHNLKKAETEVDLLGDQVDLLFGLLETIYVKLNDYSPMLRQQDSQISEILDCIKKELDGKP